MKFAIIVPTKDRPEELRRFLESVEIQETKPDQIVVVDGSDRSVRAVAEAFKNLPIDYLEVRPPGLVKQRHAGINALKPGIPVFGFFDDDIVLEPGALLAMTRFWDRHFDEYGGFGMNIIDAASNKRHGWFMKLFLIHDGRPGAVLKSCRCNPYCPAEKTHDTEWLCGGATFWKREIFRNVNFDPWFQGWAVSDDLEFCSRINREHKLVVVAEAKVRHLETQTRRGRHFTRGYIATINTLRIARTHPQYSTACAAWSWLGQGAARMAHGALTLDGGEILLGAGHLAGVVSSLAGAARSLDTQVKQ